MADTLNELLVEVQELTTKIEKIAFGSETENIEHNGQFKPTLEKQVKNTVEDSIGSVVSGHKVFQTYALMQADLNHPDGTLAEVWRDDTDSLNGLYGKTGEAGTGGWYSANSQSAYSAYKNSKRARMEVYGAVESVQRNSDGSIIVSWARLYLFDGATSSLKKIASANEVVVESGSGIYIDISSTNDSGEFELMTGVLHSTASFPESASFVADDKYMLLGNYYERLGGVLAASCNQILSIDPWLSHVVMKAAGSSVAFDSQTRTLSWSDIIYFQQAGGNRIKLMPGSVVFPTNDILQVAWLDLSEVIYEGTPATAVKIGRYYGGETRFLANKNQLPLYYFNSGESGPIAGFPSAQDISIDSENPDEIIVIHQVDLINIYIKGEDNNSSRYLKYTLKHFTDVANADYDVRHDVWRFYECWEVSKSSAYGFTDMRRIVSGGEWECAIKEAGKADFMGGAIHGNEFLNSVYILVDGVNRSITDVGNYRCKTFELFQESKLTGYGTSNATEYAKKYTHWDISAERMDLHHHLKWQVSANIEKGYLSMLPIERHNISDANDQITQTGSRSPMWIEEDMAIAGFQHVYSISSQAKLWGPTGISADVEVVKGWDLPTRLFNFANAEYYNKFYFDYCGAYATSIDEEWDVCTRYKIRTAN